MGLFSIFYMGMAGFYLVLAIYLQQECGLDALQAGTILVVNGLGYLASSSVARLADERLGRQVLALAGILGAIGLGLLNEKARRSLAGRLRETAAVGQLFLTIGQTLFSSGTKASSAGMVATSL